MRNFLAAAAKRLVPALIRLRRVIKTVIDNQTTTTLLGAYCTRTRNEGALGNKPVSTDRDGRKWRNYAPKACELTVNGPIETVS